MRLKIFLLFFLFLISCKEKQKEFYEEKYYLMSIPIEIKIYSKNTNESKIIAKKIYSLIKRISDEFSYTEAYGNLNYLNKNAYERWVKVDKELFDLLSISKNYYILTNGAFDITFSPLWTLWKEAASKRVLPEEKDIKEALNKIGFNNVILNEADYSVKFIKPVEINLGGILRGYSFLKIYQMLKKENIQENLEINIGTSKLCYGNYKFNYKIYSPFKNNKVLMELSFPSGSVMSTSGTSHFVKIKDKLYSHLLDIKTGYPVNNFSNLIIYMPKIKEEFISSAAIALMGKDKAFEYLNKFDGICAIYIDGNGNVYQLIKKDSLCKIIKPKKFYFY